MPTIKVTVPMACIGLGPGIESLGLALTLHNTVEMTAQPGLRPVISVSGEASDAYPLTSSHPVMKAVTALSQEQHISSPAVSVVCASNIPAGVGDSAAWTVAGLVAINNLLPDVQPMNREMLIAKACKLTDRAAAITSMFGGLTLSSGSGDALIYKRLSVPTMRVVLAVPEIVGYRQQLGKASQKKIELRDTIHNIGRVPLVVEALCHNDMGLLSKVMQDHVLEPQRKTLIPGYDEAVAAATQAGAAAVVLCGEGPALAAFAANNHAKIEIALHDAFRAAGVSVRTWILNTDSQGITINLRQ